MYLALFRTHEGRGKLKQMRLKASTMQSYVSPIGRDVVSSRWLSCPLVLVGASGECVFSGSTFFFFPARSWVAPSPTLSPIQKKKTPPRARGQTRTRLKIGGQTFASYIVDSIFTRTFCQSGPCCVHFYVKCWNATLSRPAKITNLSDIRSSLSMANRALYWEATPVGVLLVFSQPHQRKCHTHVVLPPCLMLAY